MRAEQRSSEELVQLIAHFFYNGAKPACLTTTLSPEDFKSVKWALLFHLVFILILKGKSASLWANIYMIHLYFSVIVFEATYEFFYTFCYSLCQICKT